MLRQNQRGTLLIYQEETPLQEQCNKQEILFFFLVSNGVFQPEIPTAASAMSIFKCQELWLIKGWSPPCKPELANQLPFEPYPIQLLHRFIFSPQRYCCSLPVPYLDLPSDPCLLSFNNILKQPYEVSNSFTIVPQIVTLPQRGDISIFSISWLHPLLQSLHKIHTHPNQANSMLVKTESFSPSFTLFHVPWESQAKRTHPRDTFVPSVRNSKFHFHY